MRKKHLKSHKILKVICALAIPFSVLSLAACGPTVTPTPKPTPIPTQEVERFASTIKDDYTVTSSYGKGSNVVDKTVKVDEDKVYVNENGVEKYTFTDSKNNVYTFEILGDQNWHKSYATGDYVTVESATQELQDIFDSFNFTSYDESTKTYKGEGKVFNTKESVEMQLTSDGATISTPAGTMSISDIENTNVVFPQNVIDDTIEQVPVEKIDAFVDSLGTNYTYHTYSGLDQNILKVNDGTVYYNQNGDINFYTTEADKLYVYSFGNDNYWHKNYASDAQTSDYKAVLSGIEDFLDSCSWESYDQNSNTFVGSNIDGEVYFTITDSGAELISSSASAVVSNVGSTKVTMPTNVKDDTIAVVSDKIYTVDEQGNYDFNITLLNEIMDDWFKGNNQWNEDALAYLMSGVSNNVEFGKIAYFDVTNEKFSMGIVHDVDGVTYLRNVSIKDSALFENLANGQIATSSDFVEYLNSVTWRAFSRSEGIQIDTTMNQNDFDVMTTNIFNRLAEVGYQGGDISNPGTKVDGLSSENVVFSFATPKSNESAGMKYWTHYYLVNDGNECKWVGVGVAATTNTNGDNYNVIEDKDGKWFVTTYEETTLDKENANLYTPVETVSYVVENPDYRYEISYDETASNTEKDMEL
ncbi:MAG: hypothetical protein ACI4R8_01490 [Candidatus Caccovivens sp.]